MTSVYEQNREKFTVEMLLPYDGQWVAFNEDGSRILAGAESLVELEARLAALGIDAEQVGFERIEFGGLSIGGVEYL